jgi:alpha-L-fucosidase
MLLNVGPTARGAFDAHVQTILEAIGQWMRLHGRSIYGATQSEFAAPPDCRFTQRGDRLYLHIFSWPLKSIHLPELAGRVAYAQLLSDGSEIQMRTVPTDLQASSEQQTEAGALTLDLPIQRPDVLVPVIELFLKLRGES